MPKAWEDSLYDNGLPPSPTPGLYQSPRVLPKTKTFIQTPDGVIQSVFGSEEFFALKIHGIPKELRGTITANVVTPLDFGGPAKRVWIINDSINEIFAAFNAQADDGDASQSLQMRPGEIRPFDLPGIRYLTLFATANSDYRVTYAL